MKYDLFIFDLDGTLIDSAAASINGITDWIATKNLPETAVGDVKRFYSMPIAEMFSELGISDIQTARDELYPHFANWNHVISVFEGVEEVLKNLQKCSTVAVATNRTEIVLHDEEHDNWDDTLKDLRPYFQAVCTASEIAKPSPEVYDFLLSQLSEPVQKERSIMIGDSPSDAAFAKNAGIDFAFASWGPFFAADLPYKPAYILSSPEEILELC